MSQTYATMETHILKIAVILTIFGFCYGNGKVIKLRIAEEKDVGEIVGNMLERSNTARRDLKFLLMSQSIFQGSNERSVKTSVFQIEETTGILKLSKVIDRETDCAFSDICEYRLKIAMQSTTNDGYFELLQVAVTIDDINDHAPTFPKPHVDLPITEGGPSNEQFTLGRVIDNDMSVDYSLANCTIVPSRTTKNLPFTLYWTKNLDGSSIIKLNVAGQLDRETKDTYQFAVVATDGGSPALNRTMSVNVTILDKNDNYPQFSKKSYDVTVKEDVKVGQVILTVAAKDDDIGKNGEIRFELSPVQHPYFSIDATTGDLKVIKKLNYNVGSSHKLTIKAIDQGDSHLKNETSVTVTVLDTVNDPPKIELNLLSSNNYSSASEYANVGAVVAYVEIIDSDSGRNGNVTCSLSSDWFKLQQYDTKQFKVIVSKTLDREAREVHTVLIQCDDKGIPSLSSVKRFEVHIQDENDESPSFTQKTYFADMYENNDVGSMITTVSAFDLDSGTNAAITYQISPVSSAFAYVHNTTGDVLARIRFDRENPQHRNIDLLVLAIDGGSPKRTGSATVKLTIKDVNDNKPVFNQTWFRFWVKENRPADTSVGLVMASDADTLGNDMMIFQLKPSANLVPFVVLRNGVIKTNRELDREEKSEYTFDVKAVDLKDERLFSYATVSVFIQDVNDNDPIFVYPRPGNDTVRVPYITATDSIIYTVVGKDIDEDNNINSKLIYSMTALNKTNYFAINKNTGQITLTAPVASTDFINKIYLLRIYVKDSGIGTNQASATLRVLITSGEGDARPSAEPSQNFIIAIAVGVTTVVISVTIVIIICIIRHRDTQRRRKNSARQNVLSQNMYAKNTDEVDNMFPLPVDMGYQEKRKKEVSFSLEDGSKESGSFGNQDSQGHTSFDQILIEPPPQYKQLDIPKGKMDDSRSDMSGDSGGDSGKGGSDDDLHNTSLGYSRSNERPKDRWDQKGSRQQGAYQMQSFPTTRQSPANPIVHQKIIPFSFKKAPSYPGNGNVTPPTTTYSVPLYYDDRESQSSSGFQSVDSNSNLNLNGHRDGGNNTNKVTLSSFTSGNCMV